MGGDGTLLTRKLIKTVKNYPALYDRNNPHYTNHSLRAKLWEDMAEEFDATGPLLANKWKNIKDCYRKYLNNKRTGFTDPKLKYFSHWVYASDMVYFNKYFKSSKFHCDTNEEDNDSFENVEDVSFEKGSSPLSDELLDESDQLDDFDSNIPNVRRQPKRRALKVYKDEEWALDTNEEDGDTKKKIKKISKNSLSIQKLNSTRDYSLQEDNVTRDDNASDTLTNIKSLDSIDLTFLAFAKTIKQFPRWNQIMLKKKITELITDEELNLISD